MKSSFKFKYPATEETIHKYAESIFRPIIRGECVTTVWVPMAGRRMWNKFIIENIELFKKELPDYKKYLLVYIEPLDLTEESLVGYIRLMAKSFVEVADKSKNTNLKIKRADISFIDDPKATYSELLGKFRQLLSNITKEGVEIVFFIGEFDELNFANKIFYNNLKSLWSNLHPRLHYIFLMRERVTKKENISEWGELNEAILQNVIYVPIAGNEDMNYWLKTFTDDYSLNLNKNQVEILKKICGGHPYLLKVAVRVLSNHEDKKVSGSELEDLILSYYELRSVAKGIYNLQDDKEKECLNLIVTKGCVELESHKNILSFFKKMGYVVDVGDSCKLFAKIFEQAVTIEVDSGKELNVEKNESDDLGFDSESGAVVYGGNTVEEIFTRQEYTVLVEFLKNEGRLLSRDDIGAVLWGKDSYEKYSDWAIDQLISKLRKKVQKVSSSVLIATVRGKGYKLIRK